MLYRKSTYKSKKEKNEEKNERRRDCMRIRISMSGS